MTGIGFSRSVNPFKEARGSTKCTPSVPSNLFEVGAKTAKRILPKKGGRMMSIWGKAGVKAVAPSAARDLALISRKVESRRSRS